MKHSLKAMAEMFTTFFKIGAFTFGGGYAMISLIQKEVVTNKRWITDDDILDIIAIAESTPGPIAINASTFVGYKVGGFWGAFSATLGMIIPSFAIITVISYFLEQFERLQAVKYAFNGIRVGIVALILKALIGLYKKSPRQTSAYVIMLFTFVAAAFTKINVFVILLLCAGAGALNSYVLTRSGKE